jgi:shikimate 5-dehydrogenase
MLAQVDGARTGLSQTHLILNSEATVNDTLVHALPAGSLVINATGMGKDLAGSPVSTRCVFPQCGVVWELNYRGALGFLKLAQAQAQSRQLTVAAGWRYFLHGWSQVVGEVLQVAVDADALANMTA